MGSSSSSINKPKHIKLTYFDFRARAEPVRLNLALLGVKYEDNRIPPPFGGDPTWPNMKSTTRWNQLPVLEVDGIEIGQSTAIARYVAKITGIHGKTALEQAKYDEIVASVQDAFELWPKWAFEADETAKAEKAKNLQDKVENLYKHLEVILGKEKYFGGSKVSWADLQLYNLVEILNFAGFDSITKNHKTIEALFKRIADIPNIKKYLANRKQTDF